jgi:hypothetical protein
MCIYISSLLKCKMHLYLHVYVESMCIALQLCLKCNFAFALRLLEVAKC